MGRGGEGRTKEVESMDRGREGWTGKGGREGES